MLTVFCRDTLIRLGSQRYELSVSENCKKVDLCDADLVIEVKPQDKPYELRGCKEVSVVTLKAVLGRMYRRFKQLYVKDIKTIAEFVRTKVQAWAAMFSSDLVVMCKKAGVARAWV